MPFYTSSRRALIAHSRAGALALHLTAGVAPVDAVSGLDITPITFTASGGRPPYSFDSVGSLPTGGSLFETIGAASYTLSGTAVEYGSFPITVTVTDADGGTAEAQYTIVVALWPSDTIWGIDPINNRGLSNGVEGTAAALITTVRASVSNARKADGKYSAFTSGNAAFTDLGLQSEVSRNNRCLRCQDLTNAAWVKAASGTLPTVLRNQVDIFGVANSASSILANSDATTVTQTIVDATSRARILSTFVGRLAGTGTDDGYIKISLNGGTPIDITPAAGPATRIIDIPTQTVATPVIQFLIEKSGDKFLIDCVQLEDQAFSPTSPIIVAGAAITRAADVITVTDVSPISLVSGAFVVEWFDSVGPISTARTLFELHMSATDFIRATVTNGNIVEVIIRSANVTVATLDSTNVVAAGGIYRIAFRYALNDFVAAFSSILDSTQPKIDSSGAVPTGTIVFGVGQGGTGSAQANSLIRRIFYLPAASVDNARLLSLAGATPAAPITFEVGETFTVPGASTVGGGIDWPAGPINGLPVPQSATWDGTKFVITGNPSLLDYVHASIAAATPYYVDAAAANDSANGLTVGTPKQKISSAIALANADGQTGSRIIVAAGTYYQDKSINALTAVQPTKHCGFVASGGRVRSVNSTEWSFPGSPDATFTNSYVGGPATAVRVFDRITTQTMPGGTAVLYTPIPLLASQAAVDAAVGGGWFNSGGVTTIRRADGARPTLANTFISGNFNTSSFTTHTKDIYIYGFDFEGGITGALEINPTGVGENKNIVMDSLTCRYAGDGASQIPAMRIASCSGLIIDSNCDASYGGSDGHNVHGGALGAGVTPYVFHLNPTGWKNGTVGIISCNYITWHDFTNAAVFGGSGGYGTDGPEGGSTTGKVYIVGTYFKTSAPSNARCLSALGSGCTYYTEKCTFESSTYTLHAVGASTVIYKRGNRTISGVESLVSGGTTVSY